MNTLRLRKIALAAFVALALAAGAVVPGLSTAGQLAGDPSQWGREARKVNEYEGQHLAGDPSQWGREARKVNEYEGQHLAGDPSQWGREAKVNEYEGQHRLVG